MIPLGTKGRAESVVSSGNTALTAGSGTLEVFATPHMTALMEEAAWKSVAPYLEAGQSSVGTKLDISHESATPIGMKVWAESEVVAADGRKISFTVAAYDEAGLIGKGTHERFVIASERFLEKCKAKRT